MRSIGNRKMTWKKRIATSLKAIAIGYTILAMLIFTLYLAAGFASGRLGPLLYDVYRIILYC